jgi:hypothetical protein
MAWQGKKKFTWLPVTSMSLRAMTLQGYELSVALCLDVILTSKGSELYAKGVFSRLTEKICKRRALSSIEVKEKVSHF